MEQFHRRTINYFYALALILLSTGLIFGFLGALEYILPGVSKRYISFEKIRPLHVSSMVFWILTAAVGAVLTFLQEHIGKGLRFPKLAKLQLMIFGLTFFGILVSYLFGIFGGREYWEFHPAFTIPLWMGWTLFIVNIYGSMNSFRKQPVYVWMWLTGGVFFLFTYSESNLWHLAWFRNEIVHDMTIQWKSYGSLVGSWNMLVYGSSIYLMDKIAGNQKYSFSNIAFWLYFLGLFNGMFNWSHHIYTLPTFDYVKHIGYAVSMTELILFARIIYLWRDSLSSIQRNYHLLSYKFIMAADIWIFVTLGLAIAMSVPALNIYMHGTHVVVGHTMGATIGINSMLLLSFIYDRIIDQSSIDKFKKSIHLGYWIIQISLPVFFLSLVTAGFIKGHWQMQEDRIPFVGMLHSLRPYFVLFTISGTTLIIGFFMVIIPAFKTLIGYSEQKTGEIK